MHRLLSGVMSTVTPDAMVVPLLTMGPQMKLYDFPGSASSFRVRIALNLKGIAIERVPVDITKGEQLAPSFLALNSMGAVPALEHRGEVFTESLAIVEYLEELKPTPALLPSTPEDRARARAIALAIGCGIQPLHAPRVVAYLSKQLALPPERVQAWSAHWITAGIQAVEQLVNERDARRFCVGPEPTLADVFLVPQVFGAVNRFKLDVSASCPTVWAIYQACMGLPAFRNAAPS